MVLIKGNGEYYVVAIYMNLMIQSHFAVRIGWGIIHRENTYTLDFDVLYIQIHETAPNSCLYCGKV